MFKFKPMALGVLIAGTLIFSLRQMKGPTSPAAVGDAKNNEELFVENLPTVAEAALSTENNRVALAGPLVRAGTEGEPKDKAITAPGDSGVVNSAEASSRDSEFSDHSDENGEAIHEINLSSVHANSTFGEVANFYKEHILENIEKISKETPSEKEIAPILGLVGEFEGEIYYLEGEFKGATHGAAVISNFHQEGDEGVYGDFSIDFFFGDKKYKNLSISGHSPFRKVVGVSNEFILPLKEKNAIHVFYKKSEKLILGQYYLDNRAIALLKLSKVD